MSRDLKDEINRLHAHVCSGLADPVRILILYSLSNAKFNVTELSKTLDVPQPTVSRHLKALRDRDMVNAEREGQSVYYSLSDPRIIEALDLLRGVLAENLENQAILAQTANQSMIQKEHLA